MGVSSKQPLSNKLHLVFPLPSSIHTHLVTRLALEPLHEGTITSTRTDPQGGLNTDVRAFDLAIDLEVYRFAFRFFRSRGVSISWEEIFHL